MKIYDSFVFFNEYDLLKIRLETYYNIVDNFVICECSKTQRGKNKPFNFENHKDEFSKWLDKIIYIKADNPPNVDPTIDGDWSIEFYQRNCIIEGLKNCDPEDLVFINDVDEFWNPELLQNANYAISIASKSKGYKHYFKRLLKNLTAHPSFIFNRSKNNYLDKTPVTIEQDFYYYYMNLKRNTNWYGTILSKYKNIKSVQDLRNNRQNYPLFKLKEKPAGWHFSYLGGGIKIKEKLNSIVEGSSIKSNEFKTLDEKIKYCVENKIDLFGRSYVKINLVGISDIGFPNIEKIKEENSVFFYKE